MTNLYRSAAHYQHWIAYKEGLGWVMFPAKENGWELRRPARGVDPMHLREVPVRLAFNTGLLDASEPHGRHELPEAA